MTDQLPSKDACPKCGEAYTPSPVHVCFGQRSSKDLCSQLRALTGGYRLLGYTAAEEIEQLQRALRGISTCSTCEACRGAALRALGGAKLKPAHEREPPHCSSCSCGMDDQLEGACPNCNQWVVLKRAAQPPGDGQ